MPTPFSEIMYTRTSHSALYTRNRRKHKVLYIDLIPLTLAPLLVSCLLVCSAHSHFVPYVCTHLNSYCVLCTLGFVFGGFTGLALEPIHFSGILPRIRKFMFYMYCVYVSVYARVYTKYINKNRAKKCCVLWGMMLP